MRLPLAIPLDARTGSATKDGRLTNAVVETYEGQTIVTQRPGLSQLAGTSGAAEGVVCFNGELIVLAGTSIGEYGSGSGGITWTQRVYSYSQGIAGPQAITYGNSVFVGVAGGASSLTVAATSPDGVTWTTRSMPSLADWRAVTFGNGTFVAVADNSSVAATSADGITWTARTLPSVKFWDSVTYGNGVFVALASGGGAGGVATSADGITWTARTIPAGPIWTDVVFGGSLFVAVGAESNACATSPDGITWTSRTMPALEDWQAVTYGSGKYVAVASSGTGTVAASSTDGISWTARTLPSSAAWNDVIYAGNFIALSSTVATSPDGITWTSRTIPAGAWQGMAYDGVDTIVAATFGSTIAATSSINGVTSVGAIVAGQYDFAQSTV